MEKELYVTMQVNENNYLKCLFNIECQKHYITS